MKQLTNFTSREAVKQEFKDLQITTKEEAVKMIHFLSILGSVGSELKEKAYAFLDNRCADCANHFADGLEVVKVEPKKKVYNETEELTSLLAEKKEIEERIKVAKAAAGYTEIHGTHYWKATNK